MRAGTRIELHGTPAMGGYAAVPPEAAIIGRWVAKRHGPRSAMPGWHVVKFSDGGALLVHESGFRVTDNRKA